jgi:hypothetical protein
MLVIQIARFRFYFSHHRLLFCWKKLFGLVKRFIESQVESESPSKYLTDSESTKSLKLLIRPFTKNWGEHAWKINGARVARWLFWLNVYSTAQKPIVSFVEIIASSCTLLTLLKLCVWCRLIGRWAVFSARIPTYMVRFLIVSSSPTLSFLHKIQSTVARAKQLLSREPLFLPTRFAFLLQTPLIRFFAILEGINRISTGNNVHAIYRKLHKIQKNYVSATHRQGAAESARLQILGKAYVQEVLERYSPNS